MNPPKTEDFRIALTETFQEATNQGLPFVEIRSGDLHKELGANFGRNNRMPSCCGAMYSLMQLDDVILQSPPKGRGSNLIIRYNIPRNKPESTPRLIDKIPVASSSKKEIVDEFNEFRLKYPQFTELVDLPPIDGASPESTLLKSRKITENVTRKLLISQDFPVKGLSFAEMTGSLKNMELIDPVVLTYLNHIRIIGNLAAHSSDANFTGKEVAIVYSMLYEYLQEIMKKDLIK